MSISNPAGPSREARVRAQAEAAAWVAKLQSPQRSVELEASLRRWLGAEPENARQFERVTEIWDAGTQVAAEMRDLPRLRRWNVENPTRRYALAATVVMGLGLALFAADRFFLADAYSTRIGEQRLLRLDDGSRVTLNSNSRIRVQYDEGRRRIELERGEAYFEVAQRPARPFIVHAGVRQVTALGTSFMVRMDFDKFAVTLLEGKVAVSAPDDSAARVTRIPVRTQTAVLAPGERITLTRNGQRHIDTPRLEAVTAWRRGEVNLEATTLADACAEMNRYDEQTLVLDAPQLASHRVSGIYYAGDSRAFAQTMARLYGLELVEDGGKLHLRSRGVRISNSP